MSGVLLVYVEKPGEKIAAALDPGVLRITENRDHVGEGRVPLGHRVESPTSRTRLSQERANFREVCVYRRSVLHGMYMQKVDSAFGTAGRHSSSCHAPPRFRAATLEGNISWAFAWKA